ncbi:MAG: hypothetical protein Q8927_21335 [Bacteroidota bacterium]|nr:hypothetical protein [Bacteroidota bacterium]
MPSIKLEVFPSTPKEIEGCSGLYSYASTAVEKQEYIFATKTEEFAIIRIGGKNISLKMVKTTEPARGIYKEVYEGNGYTAILTTKEVKKTGDEGALYVGTLEIRHGATKLVVKVHGESGC